MGCRMTRTPSWHVSERPMHSETQRRHKPQSSNPHVKRAKPKKTNRLPQHRPNEFNKMHWKVLSVRQRRRSRRLRRPRQRVRRHNAMPQRRLHVPSVRWKRQGRHSRLLKKPDVNVSSHWVNVRWRMKRSQLCICARHSPRHVKNAITTWQSMRRQCERLHNKCNEFK